PSCVLGDDPPTEPIPVIPSPPNGAVPAGPVPPWPPSNPAGPVLEGALLSDLESEYVARHFEYQRRAAAEHGKAIQVRRQALLLRRPHPTLPVLRKAVSAVCRGSASVTVHLITTVRTAATHDRTRAVARWAIRNGIVYIATGAGVLLRRVWEAHTQSRYERMMRQAELAGDLQQLVDWEQRAERARAMRHKRRMDLIYAPFALAKAAIVAVATVAGMLLALGVTLAIGYRDIAWVLAPPRAVVDLIAWAAWLVAGVWAPLALAAPWLALAMLWHVGRSHGRVPSWAAPVRAHEHESVIVTPGGIATALAHLGIGKLNEAIKKGWEVEFLTPPVRVNNCGYHAV